MDSFAINNILRATWNREISVDEALEEIQGLLLYAGHLTRSGGWYVSLEEESMDSFNDGQAVYIFD